jgi:hypothetical protein
LGIVAVVGKNDSTGPLVSSTDWAKEFKKTERKHRNQSAMALVATAVFILVFGGLAVLWFSSAPTPREAATDSSVKPMKKAAAAPLPSPTVTMNAAPAASVPSTAMPSTLGITVTSAPSEAMTSGPAPVPTATMIQPRTTGTTKKKKANAWDF